MTTVQYFLDEDFETAISLGIGLLDKWIYEFWSKWSRSPR